MKKKISIVFLFVMLSMSASSLAEQYPKEAVFDDFSVVFDKAWTRGNQLNVRLSAYFTNDDAVRKYAFVLPGVDHTGNEPRDWTKEEILGHHFYTVQQHTLVIVSFKTPEGEHFLDMKPLIQSEFRVDDPVKQPDGTWSSVITLRYDAIPTGEGVWMELYEFDPNGDAPYPGEVEQTIYIEFP